MAGLHPQSKRKRDQRVVDMSTPVDNEPAWEMPPESELDEQPTYTCTPHGADPERERVLTRMVNLRDTWEPARFAVVQQTFHRGKWRDVVVIDCAHDQDVHIHRYGKRAGARVGEPEALLLLRSLADVQAGYQMALERVMNDWQANKVRWENA